MMVLAMLEAMLGDGETAVARADRAVDLRVASGDAVLGGVLAGASLIRREPGRLLVLVGPAMDGRFFSELEKVLNLPFSVDPAMLLLEPTFARLRSLPRFEELWARFESPITL